MAIIVNCEMIFAYFLMSGIFILNINLGFSFDVFFIGINIKCGHVKLVFIKIIKIFIN